MAMHAQTPLQIAWTPLDGEATEQALTGAAKRIRMPGKHVSPDTCTRRDQPFGHPDKEHVSLPTSARARRYR